MDIGEGSTGLDVAGLKGDGYGADRKAWVLGRKACGAGRPSILLRDGYGRGIGDGRG